MLLDLLARFSGIGDSAEAMNLLGLLLILIWLIWPGWSGRGRNLHLLAYGEVSGPDVPAAPKREPSTSPAGATTHVFSPLTALTLIVPSGVENLTM